MSGIVTSDIHLTDNPKDEYRWGLLPWLSKKAVKHGANWIAILGDLTVAKDRHTAKLVNRFCRALVDMKVGKIIILKANHDYVDENSPFFKFISLVPKVIFVDEPFQWGDYLFLPHTRNWEEDWKPYIKLWNNYKIIFTHQTYTGAKAENGQALRGIPPSVFKGYRGQVISGDVHVPQRLSRRLLYVGAPYRIRFGDAYNPRVLLVRNQGRELSNLTFVAISREVAVIRNLQELQAHDYNSGDQVKIKVRLKRSEFPDWPNLRRQIKRLAKQRGWELCGLSMSQIKSKSSTIDTEIKLTDPSDAVLDHAKRKKLDKSMVDIGLKLLEEAQ